MNNNKNICYNCKKDMSAKQDPNSGYMIFKWSTVFNPILKKYEVKTDTKSLRLFCLDCFKIIAPQEYQ